MHTQHDAFESTLNSEKGFSLIELMIAMAIFSIGILAVMTMQISTINSNSGARKISDALVMANDQLENFMAIPYTSAELDPGKKTQQIDGYSMEWDVFMEDLNGDGTNDAKRIQLTVFHQMNTDKGVTIQHLIPES